MKLKSLKIELETYGPNEGKYVGQIEYSSPIGKIAVILPPEASDEYLNLSSMVIKKFALDGMTSIHAAIADEIMKSVEQGKVKA